MNCSLHYRRLHWLRLGSPILTRQRNLQPSVGIGDALQVKLELRQRYSLCAYNTWPCGPRKGDVAAAIVHLKQSGETKGSPQLNSFGPSMQLARALIQVNEIPPVLHYFKQCREFWQSGDAWLNVYEAKVRRGAVPNFFWSLYR